LQAHYLPSSYLGGFTSADVPEGQDEFVHYYDLSQGRWRRRAPKNLARLPDYYALEDASGVKHQDIEAAFSKLEQIMVEHMLPKLRSGEPLTSRDRVHIAEFVGSLFLRVPVQQEHIASQIAAIGEHYARTLYDAVRDDPGRLELMRAEIKRDTGVALSEDFSVDDLNPDEYIIEPDRNTVLITGFRALDGIVPALAAMGWAVASPAEGGAFVTSDAPVFLHSPRPPDDVYGTGFAQADVQVSCPLAGDIALVASWHHSELEYVPFREQSVAKSTSVA
jgi:hypothetical protein